MHQLKTTLLVILMVLGSTCYTQAQDQGNNNSGKVYFFRSTGYDGSAVAFKVFIDEQFVCKLKNKEYSVHDIPPGKHTCSVQFSGKKSKEGSEKFEFNVEAGKEVYMNIAYQSGLVKDNAYFEEITESSAQNMIGKLKEVSDCK
jgi:hypothetical protein